MKKIFFTFLLTFVSFSLVQAQVGVNTETPDPSAILDIKDNTKGILIPRLTSAEKVAIKNPAFSLLVYDTTLSCYSQYDGTNWRCLDQRSEMKWFYMPSIAINTEVITAESDPDLTINLYDEYKKQFSASDNTTFMKSTNAPATIPFFQSASDLYYYVTYYSKDVFQIKSISDTGLMTYRIIGNATDETHVNVVFLLK